MIVPMYKYYFFVFHKEYHQFLENLQQTGIVHVEEKSTELTEELKFKIATVNQIENTIQFLEKREIEQNEDVELENNGDEILVDLLQKQKELEFLLPELEETKKEITRILFWGDFSPETIKKLGEENIIVRFFSATKKRFSDIKDSALTVEKISESGNLVYFILIQTTNEEINIDADEFKIPESSLSQLQRKQEQIESAIESIEKQFDMYAAENIPALEKYRIELIQAINFEKVVRNTSAKVENKVMILEGWVPQLKKKQVDELMNKNSILFNSRKARPGDSIPIMLVNNRFSKLFEPIGQMFSLPDYHELDLTVFFAPFFMMFFGFCLGDAGYGLLFIVGAGLYKIRANRKIKPYLSLIQFLGLATVLFGTISGTLFGINLIQADISWLEKMKYIFLDPDKMFNLALILGAIQIIFGLFLKAANQTKQFGFSYALSSLGWLIILLGTVIYLLLSEFEIIRFSHTLLYLILICGGILILFFSDPGINVFARIGKGIWDIYSTVTGIFGDLLSYIRLFALGLSSAILGFVINDISFQILGSSKILGPVFFVIFLLLGHTLNILISSLGSFVHPMRLTFVEFYKNAGFKGGGMKYKPFTK